MDQINAFKQRYRLTGELPVSFFAQLPDIVSIQEETDYPAGLEARIIECLERACQKVYELRREEGNFYVKIYLNECIQ